MRSNLCLYFGLNVRLDIAASPDTDLSFCCPGNFGTAPPSPKKLELQCSAFAFPLTHFESGVLLTIEWFVFL